MGRWIQVINGVLLSLTVLWGAKSGNVLFAQNAREQTFDGRGVILEIKPDDREVVIRHQAITNYMDAMTMPFKVKTPGELASVSRDDEVRFQLHVTETESWVDHFVKIGTVTNVPIVSGTTNKPAVRSEKRILDYKFTNELGRPVSFNDFHGQALAITFFYTRCPLPEFCPRLSKNFQEASQKLEAMTNAPTNWHFISVSFDPAFDTPEMLKSYGESYQYDPAHWSFFTGPPDKIAELAHGAGVEYQSDDGTINHNFRTMVVDANGHLQMVFPTSGDLSDQIVAEILKAASVKSNR